MEYAFNANEVPDDGQFDGTPLPQGDYPVVAVESEIKRTKDGSGAYIDFTLEVIDGAHKGRKLWFKVNIENRNQQAVDIGQREYKRLHEAVGIASSTRTDDLHNKPFIARVGFGKGEYADRNEIKGFKPYGGATTPAAPVTTSFVKPVTAPAPAAPPPSATGSAPPPWKR